MSSRPAAPAVDRDALVEYLEHYLAVSQGSDACPNGLQIEGRSEIAKLVTGVSACGELFRYASRVGAAAVLVHHGLFWEGEPRTLTGVHYRRVAELVRHEISLLAYHLPLDRHPEVGNNAVAARELGLDPVQPFCVHDGLPIGVQGVFNNPVRMPQLVERIAELFGQQPLVFPFGPAEVTTMAIVSGSGGRCFHEAIGQGIDLFLTGEAKEWSMNLAREAATSFVAAGHYATERLGVQALGDHLHRQFGLQVEFVEIPNPV